MSFRNFSAYGLLGLLIIIVDQFTKRWALQSCISEKSLAPFVSCHVIFNRGISWGWFNSSSSLMFAFITMLIGMVILVLCWYTWDMYIKRNYIFGESLVLAGAFSNTIDRFWWGGVVDFIKVSYKSWVFPFFNIADAAIVLGVIIMVIAATHEPAHEKRL
jgi:signal peptidase II